MIACVYRHGGPFENLPVLAEQFASGYEQPDDDTILFSIAGTRPPSQPPQTAARRNSPATSAGGVTNP